METDEGEPSELEIAHARIAQLEEREGALKLYINQMHEDPFPGEQRAKYRETFSRTFGVPTLLEPGPDFGEMIRHEFATRPCSDKWDGDESIGARLDILQTLPDCEKYALGSFVGYLANFETWAKEKELCTNRMKGASLDGMFFDCFYECQKRDTSAFLYGRDLTPAIESCRRLRTMGEKYNSLFEQDRDPQRRIRNSLLLGRDRGALAFNKSCGVLRARHVEHTAFFLVQAVTGHILPEELVEWVYDDLVDAYQVEEPLRCPSCEEVTRQEHFVVTAQQHLSRCRYRGVPQSMRLIRPLQPVNPHGRTQCMR